MGQDNRDTTRTGGIDDTATGTRAGTGDAPARFDTTRRNVLRTGVGAAAGAAVLGAAGQTASAAKVDETCSESYGKIDVADYFTVMDNQWGMSGAQQCVWLNDDGSYGYDFDASNTGGGINYPEVYCGTRPWGDDTGVPEFPLRRSDVDELVMDVEANVNISGGEWDWAEEWWLMDGQPSNSNPPHTHEIMLLLDWGGGHDHGAVQERNLWTDQFGNTVSLWTRYNSGGTSATFYIFRIEGGHDGGKIDMKPIVDFLTNQRGVRTDLTISGLELGNEYWTGASGETTYERFNVTVNGTTYRSGSNPGDGTGNSTATPTPEDTTAPSRPGWLNATANGSSQVNLNWGASSDGGSGLSHYEVTVNGSQRTTVQAGTTSETIANLSPSTSYQFGVRAVDLAGNRSGLRRATATTDQAPTDTATPIDESGSCDAPAAPAWSDGTTPYDVDGDGVYEDMNGNCEFDSDDVVTYFQEIDRSGIQNDAWAYDANGNGNADFDDIVTLFQSL